LIMEKKYSLKFVLTLIVAASALTCLIISLLFYWQIIALNHTNSKADDFAELMEVIEDRFIGEFDLDEIANAAKHAAVYSLDDNWSYYLSPDEYIDFLESSNNKYSGIGVEVVTDKETGGIKVLHVYPESGADEAGIVGGDIITEIDGESILGFTIVDIRALLRRPIGERALLTVLRADGEYHTLTVIYSVVFTDPVSFEMLDNNIGYVLLKNFEAGAADGFISAVNTLIEQGAVAFIYDVRSNNGGRVGEMTQILDFLLPEGEIFISVNRSGIEQITKSDPDSIDLPAVVLVNRYSYSGAEYFTAILNEYDYAITVGEQTTGKNRMQTTIPLSNGGAVHISTGQYLTKNRISLYDTGGYTPVYIIDFTDEEYELFRKGELEKKSDPQLVKAILLLTEQ